MPKLYYFRVESATRHTSIETGEQHCNRCGLCCIGSPCQLADMGDVERLARALKKSIKVTIRRHLQVVSGKGGAIVTPKRAAPGAQCHLYDAELGCTVQDLKPTGGRTFECWTDALDPMLHWTDEELAKLRAAS